MTNVFSWSAVGAGRAGVSPKASGAKSGKPETASVFASMMSANYSAGMNAAKNPGGQVRTGAAKPVKAAEQMPAYDRYQYRERAVGTAQETPLAEKLAGASEELGSFEKNVVTTVAEKLGVTEEEVLQAMENLGLTAFDLLNPQKLVQLAVELTKADSGMDLLTNPQYLDLMKTVQGMGEELMADLELPMEQMDELISQMDAQALQQTATQKGAEELTQPGQAGNNGSGEAVQSVQAESSGSGETVQSGQAESSGSGEPVQSVQTESGGNGEIAQSGQTEAAVTAEEEYVQMPENAAAEQTAGAEEAASRPEAGISEQGAESAKEFAQTAEESQTTDAGKTAETEAAQQETAEEGTGREQLQQKDAGTEEDFTGRRESNARTAARQEPAVNEPVAGMQNLYSDVKSQLMSELSQIDSSYLSADTVDIMEQVVEKLKVTITQGLSSMEMTLNPENLGKVYLQITAREGAVHAQIAAANEAVKNALEAQAAEIQEHLDQAGIKVEAIEVTVASHEFERNLEQNQKREEREGERAQQNKRRNLNLSSLDELSGLMSEEEALAAQIMRENGNTVDLSA